MIAYFIIFQTSSFIILCIAWFIYGMSSAVNTGTIDVSFTRVYQSNSKKLKAFISSMKIILGIGAISGGYAGSVLFLYVDEKIYLISLFLYLASSLITIFFISSDKNTDHKKECLKLYINQFKSNIITLLKSKMLIELFILISSIQFFFNLFICTGKQFLLIKMFLLVYLELYIYYFVYQIL
ncbi:Multidrug resistance protein B (plasmid) [Borrelia nietonii YOR]|uniref:Multidrug resistance protein B n=2 Tax=Borrelia TaxID=138 RepID=W5SBG1_9SPIR|nr:Multidrug resistance protein B [Borrelia nietonii YOR]